VQGINRAVRQHADAGQDTDGVYEVLLQHNGDTAMQEVACRIGRAIEQKTQLPFPDYIYTLMMESGGLYAAVLLEGNERERRVLDWLYRLATEYTALTREPTIADFLLYLDQVQEIAVDTEGEAGGDAVQIMTIHQSKGKEFPVVFLVDLSEDRFPVRYRSKVFTVPRDLAKSLLPDEDERELFR